MSLNLGNVIQGAAGGAVTGSVVPGVGTVLGGVIGGIGSLFGGGGPKGTEAGNADIIAAAVGITRQQAMDLCAMVEDEAGKGGPNFDDIVKDYASHPQEILGLIPRYNRKNPGKAIYPQTSISQGINTQAANVPQPTNQPTYGEGQNGGSGTNGGSGATKTSNTGTYAMIGGGVLLVAIILILVLKK